MTDPLLVSCAALHARLDDPDLRIVDASWHLPASERDASAEFSRAHLPGAVFFDIDAHAAPGPLPHMLPTADDFARAAGALGIAESDDIVVYDSLGLFSAARVRWMFRLFGASRVAVLDGGLPAWIAGRYPLESGRPEIVPRRFSATAPPAGIVATAGDVLEATTAGGARVLDARSRARFTGEEPEARSGLRRGHVPGSVSLPFTELLEDGRLKSERALRAIFAERGIEPDEPLVTTCGSGVTAAVVALALERLGASNLRLYDGSWAEWGARPELPVERG